MRLGLFGGTFDPVHLGHLLLAESVRTACRLDEVRFIPAGDPPHKRGRAISAAKHRVQMLRLALAGLTDFPVDTRELHRTGPSYTVETLREFKQERPDDELFFLIGADSLTELTTWREPEEIARLATIAAVNRGRHFEMLSDLPEAIRSRVEIVTMPAIDLSATAIREAVGAEGSIRFQVPRAVEVYIAAEGLYQSGAE